MPAVSVQPFLALLPAGGTFKNDTLVWDLRYSNACIPVYGGVDYSGPRQSCGQDWDVLVDATTGEFIDAFSTEMSS